MFSKTLARRRRQLLSQFRSPQQRTAGLFQELEQQQQFQRASQPAQLYQQLEQQQQQQYSLQGSQSLSVAGKNYANTVALTGERIESVAQTLAIAWQGTLTTRTSNTVGTFTMTSSSHLITTAEVVDLYWTDPTTGLIDFIHNVTVGTVAGVSVPFTVPTDSVFAEPNLPLINTVVNVAPQNIFSFLVIGSHLLSLVAACDYAAAQMIVLTSAPVETMQILLQPGGAYQWIGVGTNPLAGITTATVWMSHSDPTTPRECRIAGLLSS